MKLRIKNQDGFTLIESLLSLYILTFVSSLFIMLLATLLFKTDDNAIHPFELENFVIQMQSEFREANEWSVDSNTVRMTTRYEERVTYTMYNKLIRRQVGGAGHEVVLQNVSAVHFEKLDNGIKLIITDTLGEIHIRNIYRLGE